MDQVVAREGIHAQVTRSGVERQVAHGGRADIARAVGLARRQTDAALAQLGPLARRQSHGPSACGSVRHQGFAQAAQSALQGQGDRGARLCRTAQADLAQLLLVDAVIARHWIDHRGQGQAVQSQQGADRVADVTRPVGLRDVELQGSVAHLEPLLQRDVG